MLEIETYMEHYFEKKIEVKPIRKPDGWNGKTVVGYVKKIENWIQKRKCSLQKSFPFNRQNQRISIR